MPLFTKKELRGLSPEDKITLMEIQSREAHPGAVRDQAEKGLLGQQFEFSTRERIARLQQAARDKEASSIQLQQRISAAKTGMDVVNWAKPMIWTIVIAFLIMGPGLASVFTIIQSLNIWMWLGIIVLGIMIWRNK